MPHKDKDERLAYYKQYREKNKEKKLAYDRERYHKNKEKEKARKKKYYHKNKEKICLKLKEKNKQYREENRDQIRIKKWKAQGIIDGDFDLLHEVFKEQTHCWICWEPYIGTRIKCLEHDHSIKDEPNVRYICCNTCNLNVVG